MGLLTAESVRLPGWQLGARPQVGAHLIPLAGRGGAELGQRLVSVGAHPLGLGADGVGGCLGAGGFLLRQPGAFFHLGRVGASLVPVGLCGPHPLPGLRPCLLDAASGSVSGAAIRGGYHAA